MKPCAQHNPATASVKLIQQKWIALLSHVQKQGHLTWERWGENVSNLLLSAAQHMSERWSIHRPPSFPYSCGRWALFVLCGRFQSCHTFKAQWVDERGSFMGRQHPAQESMWLGAGGFVCVCVSKVWVQAEIIQELECFPAAWLWFYHTFQRVVSWSLCWWNLSLIRGFINSGNHSVLALMSSQANIIGLMGGKKLYAASLEDKKHSKRLECAETNSAIHSHCRKIVLFWKMASFFRSRLWLGRVILLQILHIKAPCSYLMMWRRKASCIEGSTRLHCQSHFHTFPRTFQENGHKKKSYFLLMIWLVTDHPCSLSPEITAEDGTAGSFVVTVFVL